MTTRATILNVSPLRMLRRWLFQERSIRGPNAIELDVVDRQVTRAEEVVRTAAGQSTEIEQRLSNVRNLAAAALCDQQSPGVIDGEEAKQIARELISTSAVAREHTQTLEALA